VWMSTPCGLLAVRACDPPAEGAVEVASGVAGWPATAGIDAAGPVGGFTQQS
jgi:hypothetical protein